MEVTSGPPSSRPKLSRPALCGVEQLGSVIHETAVSAAWVKLVKFPAFRPYTRTRVPARTAEALRTELREANAELAGIGSEARLNRIEQFWAVEGEGISGSSSGNLGPLYAGAGGVCPAYLPVSYPHRLRRPAMDETGAELIVSGTAPSAQRSGFAWCEKPVC
jgi:hypothetical protein